MSLDQDINYKHRNVRVHTKSGLSIIGLCTGNTFASAAKTATIKIKEPLVMNPWGANFTMRDELLIPEFDVKEVVVL